MTNDHHAAFVLIVSELNRLHRLQLLLHGWKQAAKLTALEACEVGRIRQELYDIATEPDLDKEAWTDSLVAYVTPRLLFKHRKEFAAAARHPDGVDRFTPIFKEMFARCYCEGSFLPDF